MTRHHLARLARKLTIAAGLAAGCSTAPPGLAGVEQHADVNDGNFSAKENATCAGLLDIGGYCSAQWAYVKVGRDWKAVVTTAGHCTVGANAATFRMPHYQISASLKNIKSNFEESITDLNVHIPGLGLPSTDAAAANAAWDYMNDAANRNTFKDMAGLKVAFHFVDENGYNWTDFTNSPRVATFLNQYAIGYQSDYGLGEIDRITMPCTSNPNVNPLAPVKGCRLAEVVPIAAPTKVMNGRRQGNWTMNTNPVRDTLRRKHMALLIRLFDEDGDGRIDDLNNDGVLNDRDEVIAASRLASVLTDRGRKRVRIAGPDDLDREGSLDTYLGEFDLGLNPNNWVTGESVAFATAYGAVRIHNGAAAYGGHSGGPHFAGTDRTTSDMVTSYGSTPYSGAWNTHVYGATVFIADMARDLLASKARANLRKFPLPEGGPNFRRDAKALGATKVGGGSGDPTGGSGDPTGGSGDPTGGSGDPTGGSGDPTGGSGDPTGGSGDGCDPDTGTGCGGPTDDELIALLPTLATVGDEPLPPPPISGSMCSYEVQLDDDPYYPDEPLVTLHQVDGPIIIGGGSGDPIPTPTVTSPTLSIP